jgi:hypothetical protein
MAFQGFEDPFKKPTYSSTYLGKAYFSLGSAPVAPPLVPISSSRVYFPKPILEALRPIMAFVRRNRLVLREPGSSGILLCRNANDYNTRTKRKT